MRSADRRNTFCGLHDGGSTVFPILNNLSVRTQIARVQNLTAEAGSTEVRTTDSDYVSNALSGTGSRIVTGMIVVTRK